MTAPKKLLVIQAAALGFDFLKQNGKLNWRGMEFKPINSVFPAVTCTVQASFRTALTASEHGMAGNGRFHKDLMRPMFWEQSSKLVSGPRIWDAYRKSGRIVGMLFWQQSLGEDVDVLMSPAPIHKHHGGMIQDCYSKPAGLYQRILQKTGKPFNLMHYWGPLASRKSSDWIARGVSELLGEKENAPDLCLTYLPVLDYDLQRFGPESSKAVKALDALFEELDMLQDAAVKNGYDILVFGDYAIGPVPKGAVFPNLHLRKAGLFHSREIKGMQYPDIYQSAAFAVVDHEVAHVHVFDGNRIQEAKKLLEGVEGVETVLDAEGQKGYRIGSKHSGELVLIAREGYWFAYPWWENKKEAPDYATHVDIHNKPGYDPCELFFGWPPPSVSTDTSRIKGSHGRIGPGRETAFASTISFNSTPKDLVALSALLRDLLCA